MCGIAGVALNPGCTPPDLRARMAAMGESLTHRGPDDAGDYLAPDGSAALANRRLAIRDLSPAGHMPMGDAAGANWITYNGEIYNADELRDELKALGYAFRSQSDTEVILHGYAAWGEIVARRLRGMFAFAILTLDPSGARAQKLFLARDPLGIKPLVYAHHGGVFMFGSECRALLQSGWLSAEIDPTALVTYLQLGSVPAPLMQYTVYPSDAQ